MTYLGGFAGLSWSGEAKALLCPGLCQTRAKHAYQREALHLSLRACHASPYLAVLGGNWGILIPIRAQQMITLGQSLSQRRVLSIHKHIFRAGWVGTEK